MSLSMSRSITRPAYSLERSTLSANALYTAGFRFLFKKNSGKRATSDTGLQKGLQFIGIRIHFPEECFGFFFSFEEPAFLFSGAVYHRYPPGRFSSRNIGNLPSFFLRSIALPPWPLLLRYSSGKHSKMLENPRSSLDGENGKTVVNTVLFRFSKYIMELAFMFPKQRSRVRLPYPAPNILAL